MLELCSKCGNLTCKCISQEPAIGTSEPLKREFLARVSWVVIWMEAMIDGRTIPGVSLPFERYKDAATYHDSKRADKKWICSLYDR